MPGDPLDDVADDARYGIYTFITTTEKPRELAIAEDCRQLAEQDQLPLTADTDKLIRLTYGMLSGDEKLLHGIMV